jgi:leucyl aminopeptidase (aminopeptidase T)
MDAIRKNLNLFFKRIAKIKAGQNVLLITDNYSRPKFIGQMVMELAISFGANPIWVVMEPRTHVGHEPPKIIADAMKGVDVIFEVFEKFTIVHTTATKEAIKAGVRYVFTTTANGEDYLKRKISFRDLNIIAERTNKLSKMLTKASIAKLTTPYGTNVTLSLKGRKSLALHPLSDEPTTLLPDYAEATICPEEGTTEGVVVVDATVQGWGYLLREPIRFSVKKGRVEKVLGGLPEDLKKFRKIISMDKNSNNCAAELGFGTSHTVPKNLSGRLWDDALWGTVHIAVGRNNDIGGKTLSAIHNDLLMTQPSLELDGVRVLEKGRFQL